MTVGGRKKWSGIGIKDLFHLRYGLWLGRGVFMDKVKSEGSEVVLCVDFPDLAVVCGLVFDFVCVLAVAFLGVLVFSSALTRSTSCVHSVYSSGAKSRYS